MPRIRTVKPDLWEDETIGSLSRDARLLFIASFNLADDEGLLRWSASFIKAGVFMYDDDLDATGVQKIMDEVAGSGMIYPYSTGRVRLACVVHFHRHQRVNRPQPSKLIPPPLTHFDTAQMYARRDSYVCHICGGPVPTVPYQRPADLTSGAPDWTCLNASLDHLTPRSQGGTDHPRNIRLAHLGCNRARGVAPVEDATQPQAVAQALVESAESATRTEDVSLGQMRFSESFSEQLTEDSVNGSLNDSVNFSPTRVVETPSTSTESEKNSVTSSLTNSLREGKGREVRTTLAEVSADPDDASPEQDPVEDPFDRFWAVYPRRVKKEAARKAWRTVVRSRRVDPEHVITAATAHTAGWRATGRALEFIPHPASWLNAAAYDDPPERSGLRLVADDDPAVTRRRIVQ